MHCWRTGSSSHQLCRPTPVAKYIYAQGAAHGKRVQCQGGAKNHVLVLDDADLDMSTRIISDSAFGCAGQRCLAVSVAVVVGDAQKKFKESIVNTASAIHVGNGLDDSVQMGPVITAESKARIESLIAQGSSEGAQTILDGRSGNGKGNFIKPTILDNVPATSSLSTTEIFGPVLSLVPAKTLEEGIEILSRSPYGNMASIFTSSGAAARKFRYEVPAGNVGINIGVAAPWPIFRLADGATVFLACFMVRGATRSSLHRQKSCRRTLA